MTTTEMIHSEPSEYIVSQDLLADAYNVAKHNLRPSPFKIKKTSKKKVYLARPGEMVETWIDYEDTITLEVKRQVPTTGTYIVICDSLKNSDSKYQKYFMPFDDFAERYTMLNGASIHTQLKQLFKDFVIVQSKGTGIAFEALENDTPSGLYEQPASWGKGVASGANQPGYWVASTEKSTEWYFIPTTHFNKDYIKS